MRSHKQSPGSQVSDIIVYPHRRRMIVWLLLGAVSSFLCFLFFLFMLVLMIAIPSILHDGAAIALAIFFGGMAALVIWATWTIASFFSSGEPTLIINSEGIWIGKIYGSFEIWLSWEEIEGIYLIGNIFHKQLSFRPTNTSVSLSQFGFLQRILLRMNGAPIAILQSYLEKPIEEIIHQVRTRYAHELDHYHIQLHRQLNALWW